MSTDSSNNLIITGSVQVVGIPTVTGSIFVVNQTQTNPAWVTGSLTTTFSDPAESLTGSAAPAKAILVGGKDPSGNLEAFSVSPAGVLNVSASVTGTVGITGIPISSVGNFCSSGSTAFREAWIAVASGMYDVALAMGVEQLSVRLGKGRPLTSDGIELLTSLGFAPATFFANLAVRHMYEYGTTKEQMAMVAVKNRRNACFNPYAQYQEEVTLEEVLGSPMIVYPLTLYSCCPTGDGGAAAVLCSKDIAKRFRSDPIDVAACALSSGVYQKKKDYTTLFVTKEAARQAYEFSGINPEDVDVAEVHDCFSISELVHYEDLGFCKKGEGGRMIETGATNIDGKVAVNPSGGLLSKGHPLGATGMAQVAEIVWQLRGEAGKRQVKDPKVGLTHCAGGFQESLELAEVSSCTVLLFKK